MYVLPDAPVPQRALQAMRGGGGGGGRLGLQAALARRYVPLALHRDGDDELARRLLNGLAGARARLAGLRRCQTSGRNSKLDIHQSRQESKVYELIQHITAISHK